MTRGQESGNQVNPASPPPPTHTRRWLPSDNFGFPGRELSVPQGRLSDRYYRAMMLVMTAARKTSAAWPHASCVPNHAAVWP